MGVNVSQFVRDLRRRIVAGVELAARKEKQDIVIELAPLIVRTNPFLTGRSRSNWLLSDRQEPPRAEPLSANPVQEMIAKFPLAPFSKTYISNSTPYIGRLEDGFSKQRPAGFVKLAVNEVCSRRQS